MDVYQKKKELRQQIRRRIAALEPEYKKEADREIARRVLACAEYQRADCVFCFAGMADEIDTRPILAAVLVAGKTLALPRCLSDGVMEVRRIDALCELVAGSYGILEPRPDAPLVARERIGFAVIPCLSADRAGRRLGRGKGYYDRYLAGKAFFAAAICREKILSDRIPTDALDEPVDAVITEAGFFLCR